MFRRRPKVAQEPDAALSRRAQRRDKKRGHAPPSALPPTFETQADAGHEAAGDESSEPWYRQSGPLFDESFNDSPPSPPPQPPGSEAAAAKFAPPLPADPAAAATAPPMPAAQQLGQATDPGPLSGEMLGTLESPAGDAAPVAEVAQPQEDPSPWAPPVEATTRPEPGISFDDAEADDDGYPSESSDPLIDFGPDDSSSSEIAQHEPPTVVPVRGYYIARTEDTLRSVAAQFLNAPERWSELRTLNAAYPGVADLDPDELLPEGAALALPGDPLPWGRPDPVYLWTLAETFLYTAWGREPTPDEVVPFWRGLTRGALPEGEQSPPGAELPGVAEIAARTADSPAPPEAEAPPMPAAAFEMPAAETEASIEDVDTDTPADAPGDMDQAEAADLDAADVGDAADDVGLGDVDVDVADIEVEAAPTDAPEVPPGDAVPSAEVATSAEAEAEPAQTVAATEDAAADVIEETADSQEPVAAEAVERPTPSGDTAELAGLIEAVEQALEAAKEPQADDIVDAEIVEDVAVEPAHVEPVLPDAEPPPVEAPPAPPADGPPPAYAEPPAAAPLEPPPTFEEWIDEPPAMPPPRDPSAPYAGMPGASTAEAPPRPPEAEAPRVPHFLPSVTGTTPGGLTTAAQTSPVGRSLAGTAVGDAMLLWQLARRRRQSQRAAGAPDVIEQSLLQSAGSESLELIEAAMRHLYAVTVGQQRPKPNVLAVRSGTYGFEVLLDRPIPTPPGWRSASGGFVLELPQGVTARDLGAIGQGPSLCPALVPVGNTFEGPLLLNLEQLGCLAVSGPSTPAASLLGAIVGTLGSSPMADHLRITAVGFENASGMIGWEAVSFASYDSPELETLLANAYGPGDGMIELLVIGPGNDLLIQRAGQVATAPESRLSLVGATSAVSARWPWRIHVDDTGTAVVHPISITMTAARAVPPETLAQLGGTQFGSAAGGIDPAGLR